MESSSSLAALFEKEKIFPTSPSAKDVSLAYTAPRQPKLPLNSDPQRKPTSTVVYCAKTITFTKSSSTTASTSFNQQGDNDKLGIALIGNEQLQLYQVILYKDKQNVIHRIKVHSGFVVNVDTNGKSASFDGENNSLLFIEFQTEDDCTEFVESVRKKGGQAVYRSQNSTTADSSSLRVKRGSNVKSKNDLVDKPETLANAKYDEMSLSNVDKVKTNNSTSPSYVEIEHSTPVLNSHEMIPMEQRNHPNLPNRLGNEPFSYLPSSNRSENLQNQRQLQRLPYSYNAAPIHNINSSFPNNNVFMTDDLKSFMAETRSQSCEMRMHMLQLSSKLDNLLRDVSDVKTHSIVQQTDKDSDGQSCKLLDSTANLNQQLEETLKSLKQENEELRKQIYINEVDKDKFSRLEAEYLEVTRDLVSKTTDISSKSSQINDLNEKLSAAKLKLEEVDNLNKENVQNLQSKIEEITRISEIQKLKLNDFEQYYVQSEKKKDFRKELQNTLDASIKETMNKLYQNILNAFDETSKYDVKQIEQAMIKHLRGASYEMVENVNSAVNILDVKSNDFLPENM